MTQKQILTVIAIFFFSCLCSSSSIWAQASESLTPAETKALAIKKEGGAFFDQAQYKKAIQKYKESLQFDPNLTVNYYNIATAYAHLNQKKLAIEYFGMAIKKGYKEPRLYYNMGYFFTKWEFYKEAVQSYETAYKLNPTAYNIIRNLALAYRKAGRDGDAKEVLEQGLKLYPMDRALLRTLDNIKIDKNWNQDAKNPAYIINHCKTAGELCEDAGYILLKKGDKKNALRYFKIACHKDSAMSCAQGGFIAYQMRQRDLSHVLYEKGCALKSNSACSDLGDLLWQEGDKETAYILYRKGCDLGHAKACGVMGDYFIKSDPALAKRWYKLSCDLGNKEGCRRFKK